MVIDLAQICAVSQARLIPSALVVMAKSAKPEWASNPLALTKSQASLLLKLGAPLLLLLAENINDINSLDIFPPVFFFPQHSFLFPIPVLPTLPRLHLCDFVASCNSGPRVCASIEEDACIKNHGIAHVFS